METTEIMEIYTITVEDVDDGITIADKGAALELAKTITIEAINTPMPMLNYFWQILILHRIIISPSMNIQSGNLILLVMMQMTKIATTITQRQISNKTENIVNIVMLKHS